MELCNKVNREKVTAGLECCQKSECNKCPYYCASDCTTDLASDTLALLKEKDVIGELTKSSEAKLMTLEDIDRIRNMNLCGTWPFNTPPYLWISKKLPDSNQRGWICWRDICYILENKDERFNRKNYGVCWRLWTKQPTAEQTRAAKWMQHDIDELLEEIQGRVPSVLFEELKKAINNHSEESDDNTRKD